MKHSTADISVDSIFPTTRFTDTNA